MATEHCSEAQEQSNSGIQGAVIMTIVSIIITSK